MTNVLVIGARRSLAVACMLGLLVPACTKSSSVAPDGGQSVDAPPADAGASAVTFSYAPGWDGVQSVDVIGGFGLSTDWTAPLVSLTASGNTWTGTAMLPPGQYLYVFHVVGDAAAGSKALTYPRYAIDPTSAGFAPCPMASPTFSANNSNPCAQIAVPVTTTPTMFHVRGTVVVDGAPAAGYLVWIEREETSSHHYFANRVTTGSDGTYDLQTAGGNYRLQLLHPQFESSNDTQLVPTSLNILRRNISAAFPIAADVAVASVEMAFHSYASFAPVTTGTLPTTFAFGSTASSRLEVYGTPNAGAGSTIQDPWFSATATTSGSATFDGTFTTMQKLEPSVALGERYFWGIEQPHAAGADGIAWTGQTLVYPITWH